MKRTLLVNFTYQKNIHYAKDQNIEYGGWDRQAMCREIDLTLLIGFQILDRWPKIYFVISTNYFPSRSKKLLIIYLFIHLRIYFWLLIKSFFNLDIRFYLLHLWRFSRKSHDRVHVARISGFLFVVRYIRHRRHLPSSYLLSERI